jgi:hypothetical protein
MLNGSVHERADMIVVERSHQEKQAKEQIPGCRTEQRRKESTSAAAGNQAPTGTAEKERFWPLRACLGIVNYGDRTIFAVTKPPGDPD